MELTHVLRSFLDTNGRLTAFPARRKMKIYCLFYLAEKLDAGRDYSEREINEILLNWHTFSDPATLRRGCMITASWIAPGTGESTIWRKSSLPRRNWGCKQSQF